MKEAKKRERHQEASSLAKEIKCPVKLLLARTSAPGGGRPALAATSDSVICHQYHPLWSLLSSEAYHPCLPLILTTHWPSEGGQTDFPITPGTDVHGSQLEKTREAGEDKHPLNVSPGPAIFILMVSIPVTLSHMGNRGLWEILGISQVRELGGSQIIQACLAFKPIVLTYDTPVVFKH